MFHAIHAKLRWFIFWRQVRADAPPLCISSEFHQLASNSTVFIMTDTLNHHIHNMETHTELVSSECGLRCTLFQWTQLHCSTTATKNHCLNLQTCRFLHIHKDCMTRTPNLQIYRSPIFCFVLKTRFECWKQPDLYSWFTFFYFLEDNDLSQSKTTFISLSWRKMWHRFIFLHSFLILMWISLCLPHSGQQNQVCSALTVEI